MFIVSTVQEITCIFNDMAKTKQKIKLFFFFFFESYDYCLWVQNPTCSLRYGIEKTPNYPFEKANPPSPSGMEPTAHLAPNKKPLTS